MQEMEKYFLIIIWGTILLVLIIVISIMFLLQYQKKHKKFVDQQVNFQQTLLQSQLEIQEKTLKNISQEIHDNIGQVLSLVKLNLFTMDPNDNNSLITKIENSKELVSKAIIDLRDLSHSMNTDYIEEKGLVKAIEFELDIIRKTGAIKTAFRKKGDDIKFDKQKELIIFRIVQEVLNNILKHANASLIQLDIEYSTSLKIVIVDDGVGFDRNVLQNDKYGTGIRNIFTRAAMINGELNIESDRGKGCSIKIEVR
jgi:two-component system NarL family sensor kinase